MNAIAFNALRNGINRLMDDEKVLLLSSQLIQVYGLRDQDTIEAALKEWASKGYLRVLKDPNQSAPSEICVEMLSYIDRESPWADWPPRN